MFRLFNIDFSLEEMTIITVLAVVILFLVLGGMKRVFVWGSFYRDLENRLNDKQAELRKTEQRLDEAERRVRMMEIMALRGTNMAEEMTHALTRDEEPTSTNTDKGATDAPD